MSLDDRSLGEVLHFTTVVCASFAFLPHVGIGNDSAVCRQDNPNLPYVRNVQTLSLLSSPPGLMGISKPIDSEVVFMLGSGR